MALDEPTTVHSGEIYFAMAAQVLYVTRGWSELPPLALSEWLALVDARPELELRERYQQSNPDRGTLETWRELGRAHWPGLPDGEWLHFAPAGIRYLHGRTYRGGPAADRWQSLRRALGDNPDLPAWLEYVARDPYLELDVEPASPERGRVRWLDRRGKTKHVFRYRPSAVWLYRRGGLCVTSAVDGPPEPDRQRLAESLAGDLHAVVLDGAEHYRDPSLETERAPP